MDITQFSDQAPGRLVPVAGIPGATHAFVPDPLPPDWTLPERLWPLLLDARVALAELKGVGRNLARPEILLRPLERREAQVSSRLEGTVTEPKQQLLFEAEDDRDSNQSDAALDSFREVRNLARALSMRRSDFADLPLSLRLIRNMHGELMRGVRGGGHGAGRFRTYQNQINSPPRYVPPPHTELDGLLDNFERTMHEPLSTDPLVSALMFHYQFEAIHPFGDGNGRMGRALLSMMITEWCELGPTLLYMSEYFEKHRRQYIDSLLEVSRTGSWSEWVEFGLRGAMEQARSTLDRSVQLVELHRTYRDRLAESRGSVRLAGILDGLFSYPVVRTAELTRRFDVSYPTAKEDVKKLTQMGVLDNMTGVYPATHYAPEVFEIIYG